MKKIAFAYFALFLLADSVLLHGADDFPYKVTIQIINPAVDEAVPRVRMSIQTADGQPAGLVLLVTKGFPFDSDTYDFRTGNGKVIKLRPRAVVGADKLAQLVLVPGTILVPGDEYTLDIPAGKLVFDVAGKETPNPTLHASIAKDSGDRSLKYAEPQIAQKNISLMGGSVGGVASIHAVSSNPQFLNIPWLNVDLKGDADLSLNPKESTNFFNNINGEVRGWYPIDHWNRHGEFFFRNKFESDEQFKNINSVFGSGLAFFTKDPVSGFLSSRFVTNTIVSPLVIVGYDYVHQVKQDATKSINAGKNSSQFSASLRWQLPIARDVSLGNLPGLGDKFDVDVDFDLKGLYDTHAEKFLDQSWITLQLTPRTKGQVKPSLTFTWARGKAAPNFDQINALLAGLKIEF